MNELLITTAASDHLASLLRPLSPPAAPALPPGSRTAAALDRAARAWAGTHYSAASALHDHVHEVRGVLDRVRELDRSLF